MSARRPALCMLAAALGLGALGASACVDEVLVGTQRSPISSLDGGRDASWPELDAAEPDAPPAPGPDAALDAAPEPDASDSGPPPFDAAADDGPVVVYFDPDASQDASRDAGQDAAPEAGPLGPCFSCDGTVSVSMTDERFDEACPAGPDALCWQNADDTCSVQCPLTKSCGASSDCAPDQYCYFPRSDCGTTSPGWCARRPQDDCTGVGNQVCGCDGMLYDTGCHAVRAGVPIAGPAYQGSCPPVLGF